MGDPPRRPSRVTAAQARMRSVTADDGFRLGTLIDATSHGSPLLLGLAWIEPGTERVTWEQDAETHETYHILRGRVTVSWEGDEPGAVVLGPEDSLYLPPGRRYHAENSGDEQVYFVWSLTPSVP